MKKKNLIKIVPLIAITLIALTTGFSTVAFADTTTIAPSTAIMRHGTFGTSTIPRRSGGLVGTVTEINGSTLSVKNAKGSIFSVDVSSAKLFKDFASTAIAITDIKVGDSVMVRGATVGTIVKATVVIDGKFSMAGMYHGKGVFKEERGERGLKKGFGIRGVVSTISGATLTVNGANGTTYSVDASSATVFKGMPKATSTFAEIKSGDSVMVRGAVTGSTVVATEIIDGIPAQGLHHRNRAERGVQD